MKKSIIIALILCTGMLYSQEKTKPDSSGFLELKSSNFYSITYTKRSMLLKDQDVENWKEDGNNFYGFEFGQDVNLTKLLVFSYGINLQGGNIYGLTSVYIGLRPSIKIQENDIGYTYFGAGPSYLSVKDNLAKHGGYGVTASIGVGFIIYRGFGFYYDYGYEGYGNSNYNTYTLGIRYNPR